MRPTINLVVKRGWVLERLAKELEERLPNVRLNTGQDERTADPKAALNYYLPAKDFRKYPVDGPVMGFYTHGDNGFDLVPQMTACVAMNQRMGERLTAAGATSVSVIRPGTEPPARQIVFGVIGRVYNQDRKGVHLVQAAIDHGYTFVACGAKRNIRAMPRRQWPCPLTHRIEKRNAFYQTIDYLVVTATDEGGPMSVLEAIARGVPVIAPAGVGWCDEFPCLGRYQAGDWASLNAVLTKLTQPPMWEQWAEEHRVLFGQLLDAGAAGGMDRVG
jgi:glycosyltransferase involved in cell wall biosynthesis